MHLRGRWGRGKGDCKEKNNEKKGRGGIYQADQHLQKEKKKPDPQRPRGSERKRALTRAPSRPARVGLREAGVRAQGWRGIAAGGPLRVLEWR